MNNNANVDVVNADTNSRDIHLDGYIGRSLLGYPVYYATATATTYTGLTITLGNGGIRPKPPCTCEEECICE